VKKQTNNSSRQEPKNQLSTQRHGRNRRRLLQSLAAGGAVVSVKALPERWARPALDVSILPVHARSSAPAPCQVESLSCQVSTINFAYTGSPSTPNYEPNPPPYSGGANATVHDLYLNPNYCDGIAQGTASAATLSVNATVDPACGPVDLVSSLVVNAGADEFVLSSGGGTQNGVIDPGSGAVAFNNLVVAINLPSPSFSSGTETTVIADLDLRFNAPGVLPCEINITFSEITQFVGGC